MSLEIKYNGVTYTIPEKNETKLQLEDLDKYITNISKSKKGGNIKQIIENLSEREKTILILRSIKERPYKSDKNRMGHSYGIENIARYYDVTQHVIQKSYDDLCCRIILQLFSDAEINAAKRKIKPGFGFYE